MKKLGILTFQSTTNYGAQYQNFALQQYIKNNSNIDVKVINYNNEKVNNIEKNYSLLKQKSIKGFLKCLKNGHYQKIKYQKFEQFRKEYINLTSSYNKKNIKEISKEFDYYVVGSDQIWNLYITGEDYNYYLKFEKNNQKKYAYATSFGNYTYNAKMLNGIHQELLKFKKISVREKSTIEFLNKLGINNVKFVMDPTFLLSENEWNTYLDLSPIKNKKFILVYMIDNPKYNMPKIKELAKKENLEIIYVANNFFNIKGIKNIKAASPIEFLNYLKSSKYIITGSFHALCMSLIFKKDFFYILNNKLNRNSRIIDLMEILDIKNKDITQSDDIILNSLDYDSLNIKIKKEIENSKILLNEYIREWEKNE